MKKLQKTTALWVVILSMVFLNLYSGEKKEVNKTFKPADTVRIRVVCGDCVIKKGKSSEITVHLVYTFPDDRYKPVFKEEGDTLILEEEFTRNKSGNGRSSWTVTVPEKTDIDAKTASGHFSAAGLKSEISVKVASGDIKIGDFKGKLRASAASGDVTVEDSSGKMKLNTASGNIAVNDVQAVLDVNCASGSIDISGIVLIGESEFKAVSGNIDVKLAKTCEYDLGLNTVSGDITLDYNGNPLQGYFKFSGPKGNIDSPYPFDDTDESRYSPFVKKSFQRGGNSPKISLKSVSGDLRLKK